MATVSTSVTLEDFTFLIVMYFSAYGALWNCQAALSQQRDNVCWSQVFGDLHWEVTYFVQRRYAPAHLIHLLRKKSNRWHHLCTSLFHLLSNAVQQTLQRKTASLSWIQQFSIILFVETSSISVSLITLILFAKAQQTQRHVGRCEAPVLNSTVRKALAGPELATAKVLYVSEEVLRSDPNHGTLAQNFLAKSSRWACGLP